MRIVAPFSRVQGLSLPLMVAALAFLPELAIGIDCLSPPPTVCGSTFANGDSQGVFMSTAAVPPFPIEFQGIGNTAAIVGSGPGGMSASSMANVTYGWLQAFSLADNGSFTTQVTSFIGRGRTATGGEASFRDEITVNSTVLPAGQPVQIKVTFSGSGAYPSGEQSSGSGTLQYSVFSITRNFFLVLTPNDVISLNSQFPTWVAQHTLDVLVGEKLEIRVNIGASAFTDNEYPYLVIAGAADTSARAFLDSLNPDVTLVAASGYDYRTNATGPVTLQVVCPVGSLQSAINGARAGATLSVVGTCNENILIRNEKQRITIDGAGAGAGTRATVNAPGGSPGFNVRGKGIAIQNFVISGGSHGVAVNRGSNAVLNNNLIQNTNGSGIVVDQLAFSVITNNTIQNNPEAGILVDESSTARIGFNLDTETTASPNTIQSNGIGIAVMNNSSARVVGNTISANSGDGIIFGRSTQGDVSSNTIDGNGGDGIKLSDGAAVQLGEDSGTSIYQTPNATTVNNGGAGVSCGEGGLADGRQGSLTGMSGATSFDGSCINSLAP